MKRRMKRRRIEILIFAHATPKKLRNECNSKWLRISMPCHKFSNLGEIFQGDLNDELMNNVTSKDFMDPDCNCQRGSAVNGNCICGGNCRKSMAMHKATHTECGCFHIGNAQQKLKNGMNVLFLKQKIWSMMMNCLIHLPNLLPHISMRTKESLEEMWENY